LSTKTRDFAAIYREAPGFSQVCGFKKQQKAAFYGREINLDNSTLLNYTTPGRIESEPRGCQKVNEQG
jgi:hypothetical protein